MSDLQELYYEQANKMFDSEVFVGKDGRELLDDYNHRDDDVAHDILFDIISEMVDAALEYETPTSAMRDVLMARKDEFLEAMMN